ncbi:hypothetical protein OG357_04255 [Streptomyces sp. NBC_01255]|uniref:HEAT repeat domain-containing protein n=1 Tax=Streptomyces sp. NBC_01255 TaxID=2903798 RepID=UPI002E33F06E|nr:HEAT repeat domain-containing protein [Streptomyces sp. NBC_01255]
MAQNQRPQRTAEDKKNLRVGFAEYRRRALRGLVENGTADHTEAVAARLADPEARSEAVNALARLGDSRAVGPLLREHLADDSSFARCAGTALDQVEQRIGGPPEPPAWRELGPVVFTAQAVMGVPWCVTEILVEPGQTVRGGELMAILENDAICQELIADRPGTVTEVRIAVNDEVPEEAVVLVVQSRRRIGSYSSRASTFGVFRRLRGECNELMHRQGRSSRGYGSAVGAPGTAELADP